MAAAGFWVLFGLAILSSASSVLGYERYNDYYFFLKRQLLHGFLPGLVLFFLFFFIDYRHLKRYAKYLLYFSIALLILVFIPGVGAVYNSSRSWLNILGFSFQPAEVVKLTFIIYLAAWFEARRGGEVKNFYTGLLPFLVTLGVIVGLIMMQPDMGTMMIIAASAFAIYFVAGAPMSHIFGVGGAAGILFLLLIKIAPYRAARLTIFLHPELDPQGLGYQINQALLAIGSGGIFGLGLGQSRQKFMYLPEPAGDSVFAIMAEEMGFIFLLFFFAAVVVFVIRGIQAARRAPDLFGRLLATGIISWLVFQTLVNVGAMVGIMPLTGVPLPFVSYGGTALMSSLAALGILGNISRHSS